MPSRRHTAGTARLFSPGALIGATALSCGGGVWGPAGEALSSNEHQATDADRADAVAPMDGVSTSADEVARRARAAVPLEAVREELRRGLRPDARHQAFAHRVEGHLETQGAPAVPGGTPGGGGP